MPIINNDVLIKDQMKSYLDSLNITYNTNVNVLGSQDYEPLDFYFPEQKIAIDTASMWADNHSFPNENPHLKAQSRYFIKKILAYQNAGIKLMVFWEHWMANTIQWETIKDIIGHTFGNSNIKVFARKCDIVELSTNEDRLKAFYNENALFKNRGGTFAHGLIYQNELVMAMTCRKKLDSEGKNVLLIERAACKHSYNIPGGVSRLIKNLNNFDYDYLQFMTVTDYAVGGGLVASGFEGGKMQPTLWQLQCHKIDPKADLYKSTLLESRGRGSYQEYKKDIAEGIQGRVYTAGTKEYRLYKNKDQKLKEKCV